MVCVGQQSRWQAGVADVALGVLPTATNSVRLACHRWTRCRSGTATCPTASRCPPRKPGSGTAISFSTGPAPLLQCPCLALPCLTSSSGQANPAHPVASWVACAAALPHLDPTQCCAFQRSCCLPCRRTHPNDHGHQVLAELLAGLVLGAVDEQQRRQEGGTAGLESGWAQRSGKVQQAVAAVPPPMIPGNAEEPTSLCAIQVRAL